MAIYGIKSRPCSKTEYFSGKAGLAPGDYVLVAAPHAETVAKILTGPHELLPGSNEQELPAIIRLANEADMDAYRVNQGISRKAKAFCKERIAARKLEMKLVDVEVFHDRSKFVFYFTSPTRIDFRELVKDLVAEYRARIELRQIGVRHETQMVGAIGNCGQVCCCHRYLRQFAPVAIRMAKDQNLFLNPSKISGMCGRLLCCLSYEQDAYEDFYNSAPKQGRKYQTDQGILKICALNMFKNTVSALTEKNEEQEMSLESWNKLHPVKLTPDFPETEESSSAGWEEEIP